MYSEPRGRPRDAPRGAIQSNCSEAERGPTSQSNTIATNKTMGVGLNRSGNVTFAPGVSVIIVYRSLSSTIIVARWMMSRRLRLCSQIVRGS